MTLVPDLSQFGPQTASHLCHLGQGQSNVARAMEAEWRCLNSKMCMSNATPRGYQNDGFVVSKAMADNLLLTGKVLCQKWKKFGDLVGVPEDKQLNFSKGWLTNFKERNGLKDWKCHGVAALAVKETVELER
jgi:hypothetical protein